MTSRKHETIEPSIHKYTTPQMMSDLELESYNIRTIHVFVPSSEMVYIHVSQAHLWDIVEYNFL